MPATDRQHDSFASTLGRWGWDRRRSDEFIQLTLPECVPGRIVRTGRNAYHTETSKGQFISSLGGSVGFRADDKTSLPAVGDWVAVSLPAEGGRAAIRRILERRTCLIRQAAGARKREDAEMAGQVVAANVDLVVVVTGLDQDFNLGRIERYLAFVRNSGAEVLLLLSKSDMVDAPDRIVDEVCAAIPGTMAYAVNSHDPETLTSVIDRFKPGLTTAFVGSSGVGKSTLINNLYGSQHQRTGSVSSAMGKGRHTTTERELLLLKNGTMLIDNPGIRELEPVADEQDLEDTFADIEGLTEQCRFRNCGHGSEPGCAVRPEVDAGRLEKRRFDNYQELMNKAQERTRIKSRKPTTRRRR